MNSFRLDIKPASPETTDSAELAALVHRIAARDQSALTLLHKRVARQLTWTAKRVVHSRESAQEIVGDVLLYVWKHASRYDATRGTVQAWLHVATRSRAIDFVRAARKHLHDRSTVQQEPCAHDRWTALAEVVLAQESAAVRAAISELPVVRREVVLLAYFEDFTCSEIAQRLGLPLGSVKSHVRRALIALRSTVQL